MKRFWFLGALVALAMALTGCGTPSNTSATDVACSDVESELAVVNEQLEGTLSILDRQKAEEEKAALEASQAECASESPSPSATPTPTPTPTATSVAVVCPGSWAVVVNDRGDKNRWVATGVPAIAKAKTAKQAEKALDKWLVIVREDNVLLAGAVNEFFGEKFKPEDFVDDKCISEEGVQWALKLEGALATAVVKPAKAPATGANNTGVEGEKVVSSGTAVITGDRAAVKVVLANGKGDTAWVMARCGNLVVKKPVSPKGKTDNPPPPRPPSKPPTTPPSKPKCPDGKPVPPNGLCPKDPSKDVNVNPKVPAQVKGPGTTPVGGDPGPATKPIDDDTGGAPAPSSSPTPTSAPPPPSGGGTDPGVIPEPTTPPSTPPEIISDPPVESTIAPPPPPPA